MKIRVFRPREYKIGTEQYEELTEHGCHPSDEEVRSAYVEGSPIFIDVKLGDIIEVDGLRYFYAPSGIEIYEPIREYGTLEKYLGE